MSNSTSIVQKLWNYCNILRDDGLSYGDYVEQLTFLLFLKMADEQSRPPFNRASPIPKGFGWDVLVKLDGDDLEMHYRHTLEELGKRPGLIGVIFRKAQNKIQDPAKLRRLIVDLIDKEEWSSLDTDVKGDAYEGLLQKNAEDVKGGAGQYFTPRPLIAGDGGGDAAASRARRSAIRRAAPAASCSRRTISSASTTSWTRRGLRFLNTEHTPRRGAGRQRRAALLDESPAPRHRRRLRRRDGTAHSRAGEGRARRQARRIRAGADQSALRQEEQRHDRQRRGRDLAKRSLTINRDDFWATTSNKQLNFLQHIFTILKQHGRAAVVVPDNVLFEGGAGETIRRELLKQADVHTLLRLPTGIFYAQGVKANVLFFDRKPAQKKPWTTKLWIYDLRTNLHFTLKENTLKRSDLDDFVACYFGRRAGVSDPGYNGNRHDRKPTWTEENDKGRWRSYDYDELIKRDKINLDIFWLKDEALEDSANLPAPEIIAADIVADLEAALEQFATIAEDLKR